jgi:hypothetical protein
MCKYCDINNYKSHSWTDQKEIEIDDYGAMFASLQIVYIPTYNQFFIEALGDDTAGTQIKFCPFCGREL